MKELFKMSVKSAELIDPITYEETDLKNSIKSMVNKPSSPRHFFEKLYGDLNTSDNKSDSIDVNSTSDKDDDK